jgi:hypothetical protein
MLRFKRNMDKEFCSLIARQCELSKDSFDAEDDVKTKYLSERLKLVQSFDPAILRLSTWPFDRSALVKFGITPILTLLASFLRQLTHSQNATP